MLSEATQIQFNSCVLTLLRPVSCLKTQFTSKPEGYILASLGPGVPQVENCQIHLPTGDAASEEEASTRLSVGSYPQTDCMSAQNIT